MSSRHVVFDPIHGRIDFPPWLVRIQTEPAVRRMLLIRQLGLKAYIDYPGAIHTRYSHALGTMHLAKRLLHLLADKQEEKGRRNTADNLRANENNLEAAGFFHDIGHGPFSHAVDFALQKLAGKTHEDITCSIVDRFGEVEDYGVTVNSVKQIVCRKHSFPFVNDIINGPLDVDKLDYLLRDSYHVGLRYGFDLDHFARNYVVLGDEDLEKCELGLDYTQEAVTSADLFLLIWKTMYDLVYHIRDSRVAEKMLEKAILLAAQENELVRGKFTDEEQFVNLNDESLLSELAHAKGFPGELVNDIKRGRVFELASSELFTAKSFGLTDVYLDSVLKASSDKLADLSDQLTRQVCEGFGFEYGRLICDFVKGKALEREIHLDRLTGEGEPFELRQTPWSIASAIEPKITLNTYIQHSVRKKVSEELIKEKVVGVLGERHGSGGVV